MIAQIENQMDEPLKRYDKVPKYANARKEFIKYRKQT